jgi:hypothetical protein
VKIGERREDGAVMRECGRIAVLLYTYREPLVVTVTVSTDSLVGIGGSC